MRERGRDAIMSKREPIVSSREQIPGPSSQTEIWFLSYICGDVYFNKPDGAKQFIVNAHFDGYTMGLQKFWFLTPYWIQVWIQVFGQDQGVWEYFWKLSEKFSQNANLA